MTEQTPTHIANAIQTFQIRGYTPDPTDDSYYYHYTSQVGAYGMISSKKIRLYNIAFMNDASEFKHGVELFLEQLRADNELMKQIGEEDVKHHLSFYEDLLKGPRIPVYIFCLSEDRDVLSQWRAYASNGRGVALGFRPINLKYPPNTPYIFKKVLYKQTEKELVTQKVLAEYRNVMSTVMSDPWVQHNDTRRQETWHELTHALLIQIYSHSLLMKHESFQEEKEFRVACLGSRSLYKTHPLLAKFHPKVDHITDYVEIDIDASESNSKLIVSIGPCMNKSMDETRVLSRMFRDFGVHSEITTSSCPLLPGVS